jgi:hypothetical protein
VVQTVYRAVFGAALIHVGRETQALVPGCTNRPADLLAIVDGLDADHPDIPRRAIEVTVRDRVGAHKLSLVGKGLTSPGGGAAGSEERKRKEFIKKVERGAAFAPGWTPDFSFHPMDFDLNGAWGPSALCIVDFPSRLASQRTTEPQARIRRGSIQAVSRNISERNATLFRARCIRLGIYRKLGTRVDQRTNPSATYIGFGQSRRSSSTNYRILKNIASDARRL